MQQLPTQGNISLTRESLTPRTSIVYDTMQRAV